MKSIFKFVIAAVTQQVASKSSGVDYDAMTNWYAGTEPENVVYAVTCGSEEPLVDVAGIKYSADRGFSPSEVSGDGYNKKRWNVPNTVVY